MTTGIAAFDFDGTLTQRDTLLPFLRFVRGTAATARAFAVVAPLLARRQRDEAKQRMLSDLLAGYEVAELEAAADVFRITLTTRWRGDTVSALREHQRAGRRVLVVSASPAIVVRAAVAHLDVTAGDVLATELESADGRVTGRLLGANCRGAAKVDRLRTELGDAFDTCESWAYGDSSGDREMLAWATYPTKVAGRALRPGDRTDVSASATAAATLSG